MHSSGASHLEKKLLDSTMVIIIITMRDNLASGQVVC